MNRLLILVISLFIFIHNVNAQIHVTILYESLCSDSEKFMHRQLYPLYYHVKHWLHIEFVPFGKANSIYNGHSYSFTCQHGEKECHGNMVQACVLHQLNGSQDAQVEFVVCQMTKGSDPSGTECAERVGIHYSKIHECLYNGTATKLMLNAEATTMRYSPSFIPTIIINQNFDQRLQDNSIQSFKHVVCEHVPHIPVCNNM